MRMAPGADSLLEICVSLALRRLLAATHRRVAGQHQGQRLCGARRTTRLGAGDESELGRHHHGLASGGLGRSGPDEEDPAHDAVPQAARAVR